MRRLLALALPVVAAIGMLPATAAPVTTSRMASVRLTLPAATAGHLVVEVTGITGAPDRVHVAVSRCLSSCDSPVHYEGRLAAGSLKVDAHTAQAQLTAVVGGLPIRVTWTPDAGTGVVAGGINGGGNDTSNGFEAYHGDPAVAAVTLPTGSCHGPAVVGDQVLVSTSDGGDPSIRPLSALSLRGVGAPACKG